MLERVVVVIVVVAVIVVWGCFVVVVVVVVVVASYLYFADMFSSSSSSSNVPSSCGLSKYGIQKCPFDIYSSILVRVITSQPSHWISSSFIHKHIHTHIHTYTHIFTQIDTHTHTYIHNMCYYQTLMSQNGDIGASDYPSAAPLLTQTYRTISFLDDTIGLPKWLGILWWQVRLALVNPYLFHTYGSTYIHTYIFYT